MCTFMGKQASESLIGNALPSLDSLQTELGGNVTPVTLLTQWKATKITLDMDF